MEWAYRSNGQGRAPKIAREEKPTDKKGGIWGQAIKNMGAELDVFIARIFLEITIKE